MTSTRSRRGPPKNTPPCSFSGTASGWFAIQNGRARARATIGEQGHPSGQKQQLAQLKLEPRSPAQLEELHRTPVDDRGPAPVEQVNDDRDGGAGQPGQHSPVHHTPAQGAPPCTVATPSGPGSCG